MGVKPAFGRFYNAAECRPNAKIPVVVASYPYWKKLGGRADFIGKPLTVNGQTYTLIGVTPEGFAGANALARARSLVAARRLFAARLGVQRHERQDGPGRAEKLHAQPHRADASRPNDRVGQAAPAGSGQRLTAIQPPDATGARELQIQEPSRFSISTTAVG